MTLDFGPGTLPAVLLGFAAGGLFTVFVGAALAWAFRGFGRLLGDIMRAVVTGRWTSGERGSRFSQSMRRS